MALYCFIKGVSMVGAMVGKDIQVFEVQVRYQTQKGTLYVRQKFFS
jgi:hypothetical protein